MKKEIPTNDVYDCIVKNIVFLRVCRENTGSLEEMEQLSHVVTSSLYDVWLKFEKGDKINAFLFVFITETLENIIYNLSHFEMVYKKVSELKIQLKELVAAMRSDFGAGSEDYFDKLVKTMREIARKGCSPNEK